jgi:sec-independent protein translocase protein TatA
MYAIFGLPGGTEWVVVGLAALLLFGRRLPEVARSLGKGVVEFKKGLQGVEDEIRSAGQEPTESESDGDAKPEQTQLPRKNDGPAG